MWKQTILEYFMNYAFSSSELNDVDPVLSSAIELQTGGGKNKYYSFGKSLKVGGEKVAQIQQT